MGKRLEAISQTVDNGKLLGGYVVNGEEKFHFPTNSLVNNGSPDNSTDQLRTGHQYEDNVWRIALLSRL